MVTVGSDSEPGSSGDETLPPPDLRASFQGYKALIFMSIVGECWFVWAVGHWRQYFKDKSDVTLPGQGKVFNSSHLWTLIAMLVACLLARCCIILSWRSRRRRGRDNRYGSLFMFFSTMQWIYYLAFYYRMSEGFTGITWSSKVQVSAVIDNNWLNSQMGECLVRLSPLECRTHVKETVTCTEPFNDETCSGYSWVGTEFNVTKCCVRKQFSLARPDVSVGFGEITIDAMFSFLQWVAVLAVKWALECSPFFDVSTSTSFVSGCTVDILDAVVFAQYLLSDSVLYPKYGIKLAPKGDADFINEKPYWALFSTWAVAITLATLSPVLYTFCKTTDASAASGDAKPRSFEDAVTQLVESLRMLQPEEAHACVDEAVQLQSKDYADQLEECAEGMCVLVDGDEETDYRVHFGRREKREGTATAVGAGEYHVSYDDGEDPEEETLPISDIQPNFEKYGSLTPNWCSGWCTRERICAADSRSDRFEARAEVFDAVRSLLTLEMPFFLWRAYFEGRTAGINSFVLILMSKNLIWGFMDLLIILSCANRNATCLGNTIVNSLDKFVSGSAVGSVWVGPAGIFRMAADTVMYSVKSGLQQQKEALNLRKAWLLVERTKIAKNSETGDGWKLYNEAISRTDRQLKVLEQKASRAHY